MKRLSALVFVVALSAASLVWAQPGGGRGGMMMGGPGGMMMGGPGGGMSLLGLAQLEAVQKEIEAVEDQVAAIRKLAEESQAARRPGERPDFRNMDDAAREKAIAEMRAQREKEAAATTAKLGEILLPLQMERLEQIALQMRGTAALADPAIAAKLELTAAQKQKLEAAMTANREAMQQAFQGARGQDREQMRTRFQQLRTDADAKLLAVLTTAQKAAFEKMKGPAFTMPEGAFGRGPQASGQPRGEGQRPARGEGQRAEGQRGQRGQRGGGNR
jgi:Spy/CpxP family protein refolding chaperone